MIELFPDLPTAIKQEIANIINAAFESLEIHDCTELIAKFANNCTNEDEKNFIDFYFKFKLEQIRNESNND